MEFKENLKEIRKSKGLKQKDICQALHVSYNCYASWEQGRTQPDINNIRRLCAIFDVSADYLLCLENEEGISLRENFLPSDIIPNKNQK